MKLTPLFILLFILPVALMAQISWDGTQEMQNISDQVRVYEDPTNSLSVEEVLTGDYDFQKKESPILNFGFTESDFWIKFKLKNAAKEPLILEFGSAHLKEVNLYQIQGDRVVETQKSGYQVNLHKKLMKHHFQLFLLDDAEAEYLVRMSPPVQPVPVKLYKEGEYEVKMYRQHLVFGFYVGFMAFVILSNLFYFYSLKNRLFLFYAGVVVLYLSYSAFVMDGFITYFIQDLDIRFWYIHIPTLGVIIQLVYAIVFLEVRKYSTRLYNVARGIAIYFALYFFIKLLLPNTVIYAINTLNATISFFTMFFIGYISGRKGNRLGYYFASAYFIYFLLVLTEGIYIQIGKPGYFAEMSHVTWATLIEAIILSFLLSRRFEWEKQETEEAKIAAQKEALEKTKENERIIKEQNVVLEAKVSERTEELQKSYEDLKNTQEKLVQSEKLASLGELTAGIAHEIKNPLNFVNNFAELGNELIGEVDEFIEKEDFEEVKYILKDLKINLDKINEHGNRADSIVKSMLLHSRSRGSTKEKTSLNKLCEEYTKLAFHGYRAKDKSFTADFDFDFDEGLPEDSLVNQDFGRVLLNLITNAFYAVNKKFKTLEGDEKKNYKPLVTVKTVLKKAGNEENVHIFILDNGIGIPEKVQAKIFQPFFTTKPAGEGTGLGLSLVFDIIKSYQGSIEVVSEEGEGTSFEIIIPLTSFQ